MALYREIRDTVRERILSGEYAPGSQLPIIRDFMAEFGTHGTMIRHALGGLAQEGLIVRRQGAGTWVSDPLPEPVADGESDDRDRNVVIIDLLTVIAESQAATAAAVLRLRDALATG